MSQSSRLYHFAFTVSLPISERNAAGIELFKTWHRMIRLQLITLKVDKYIFQLENSGNDNYHYQGYFHMEEKKRISHLIGMLKDHEVSMHIMPASKNGIEELKKYCMKEDTRVDGPWADHRIATNWHILKENDMYLYQRELTKMFTEDCRDNRSVYWLFDPHGCSGKSSWGLHMMHHHDAGYVTWMDYNHLTDYISAFSGKNLYVFNFAREPPNADWKHQMYPIMEGLKDGYIVTNFYKTKVIKMDPPHVVVLANYFPKLACLSWDRWKIMSIDEKQMIKVWSKSDINRYVLDCRKEAERKKAELVEKKYLEAVNKKKKSAPKEKESESMSASQAEATQGVDLTVEPEPDFDLTDFDAAAFEFSAVN